MDSMPALGAPTIDVIVSTYNEERYITRCLDGVLEQDYPTALVTVWLVDGGSTDATVDIVRRRAHGESRLRVIADGRRLNLPEALNIAVHRSTGELIAKIDAHGFPEPDLLRRAVDALETEGAQVACVGGQPVQVGETPFGRALALARTSRFGVGGGTYAVEADRADVRSVQCGVYRRAPLVAVGGFDPVMSYGEDEELNFRLTEAGHRILMDRRIRFHYITRPSWRAAYRQYRNYGEARVKVVRKHARFLRPHHLAPALAVVGGSLLAMMAPMSVSARRALSAVGLIYAGAAVGAAASAVPDRDLGRVASVAVAYTALHLGYGVGMLRGYRNGMRAGA